MKRIVICMDGTWQSLNQDDLTNIGVIARSIAHKETRPDGSYIYQTVIYTQGVGSTLSALAQRTFIGDVVSSVNRLFGGAFGEGLEDGILDTYLRLAFDYEAGDQIYIFGFSRGAFAARRLSGLINTAGIVSRRFTHMARAGYRLYHEMPRDDAPEHEKEEYARATAQFRRLYGKGARNEDGTRRHTEDIPPIAYLGVFDTVAQRGLNDVLASLTPWNGELFRFKNYRVASNVQSARHAVAVDENRLGFPVVLWEGVDDANTQLGRTAYEQRWFPGTHGDVGGGDGSKLSALALRWIADGAAEAGLRFYATYGTDRSPKDERLEAAGRAFDCEITRCGLLRSMQPMNMPLRGRRIWTRRERPTLEDLQHLVDESVLLRATSPHVRPRYRPAPLRPFRKALKQYQPPAE